MTASSRRLVPWSIAVSLLLLACVLVVALLRTKSHVEDSYLAAELAQYAESVVRHARSTELSMPVGLDWHTTIAERGFNAPDNERMQEFGFERTPSVEAPPGQVTPVLFVGSTAHDDERYLLAVWDSTTNPEYGRVRVVWADQPVIEDIRRGRPVILAGLPEASQP